MLATVSAQTSVLHEAKEELNKLRLSDELNQMLETKTSIIKSAEDIRVIFRNFYIVYIFYDYHDSLINYEIDI